MSLSVSHMGIVSGSDNALRIPTNHRIGQIMFFATSLITFGIHCITFYDQII